MAIPPRMATETATGANELVMAAGIGSGTEAGIATETAALVIAVMDVIGIRPA